MPLQELCNRVFEEKQLPIQPCEMEQYPMAVYKKNTISCVRFKTFTVGINDIDNCALLLDNCVVFVLDIFKQNEILFIRAKRFLNPLIIYYSMLFEKNLVYL